MSPHNLKSTSALQAKSDSQIPSQDVETTPPLSTERADQAVVESAETHLERPLILMIDDEPAITDSLSYSLKDAGFSTLAASSFAEAHTLIIEEHRVIQLVILDLSLPDGHGFDWLKQLRAGKFEVTMHALGTSTPVVILSSHDDEIEHIVGLEIGADDFIDKPFSPREVVARVRAVLRRARSYLTSQSSLSVVKDDTRSNSTPPAATESALTSTQSGLWVDYDQYRVLYDGVRIGLSQQEFELFDALRSGRGRVFSRAQLINIAWGSGVAVSERTVDVHINSLRKKWSERGAGELIETVRGVGYRLADSAPLINSRGVKIL